MAGGGSSKDLQEAAEKIKEECGRYFARMNQTDTRVQTCLTEIKGLSQAFEQKQDKLKSQMIQISNVKGMVTTQLN